MSPRGYLSLYSSMFEVFDSRGYCVHQCFWKFLRLRRRFDRHGRYLYLYVRSYKIAREFWSCSNLLDNLLGTMLIDARHAEGQFVLFQAGHSRQEDKTFMQGAILQHLPRLS
jgi:hypothetical protein